MVSIYPNPELIKLIIDRRTSDGNQSVKILNYLGQKLYRNSNFKGDAIEVSSLENGIYLLRYSDQDEFSIERFVVQHN
ncbi:MAG: T9SS type A sorting domain-containing protein [Bacteroidetes bacterium]|nr:T9SS type A sorting domain-containing protein [Bacteroidota bacterium]